MSEVAIEPRVEDLLATIRQAIDRDIDELDKAGARSAASALREAEPRDSDRDITKLRERMGRAKVDMSIPAQSPVVPPRPSLRPEIRESGIGRILSGSPLAAQRFEPLPLRTHFVDEPEPMPMEAPQHYAEPVEIPPMMPPQTYHEPYAPPAHPMAQTKWPEALQPHYQPLAPVGGSLMSREAALATENSFQALADALVERVGGELGVQDMARDMLRPMLKQWLDENLPPMVERIVREEIERVARRGR